jgi:hypothetical protein
LIALYRKPRRTLSCPVAKEGQAAGKGFRH